MESSVELTQENNQTSSISNDGIESGTNAENGGVKENIPQKNDSKTSSDKELSLEKIVAEFTEEQEFEDTNTQNYNDLNPAAGSNISEPVNQLGEIIVGESSDQTNEDDNNTETQEGDDLFNKSTSADNYATPLNNDTIETAVVEITELKDDEAAAEESNEISYTVVEMNDAETHEVIEEHVAQMKETEETVLIINTSEGTTEITIDELHEGSEGNVYVVGGTEQEFAVDEPEEVATTSQSKSTTSEKPKKPRGRRPIADIPLHVLGRDITNPTEVSNGGRSMPKPRLGVKVPYKNLTSQIVSKAEIEQEIMERTKVKQEQLPQSAKDALFARKLTQRLAKKIAEKDKTGTEKKTESAKAKAAQSEIKNNSDLIAILEGDDDVAAKPVSQDSEREIALKQLEELPNMSNTNTKVETKNKFFKSRGNTQTTTEQKKTVEKTTRSVTAASTTKNVIISSKVEKTIEKTQSTSNSDVEPRLKTGMVVKTYTRKRKSADEIEEEDDDDEDDDDDDPTFLSPEKSPTPVLQSKNEEADKEKSGVYVTKSSRVIKRKVIWDPDEAPAAKTPLKSPQIQKADKKAAAEVEKKTPAKKPVAKNEAKIATNASTKNEAKSAANVPSKPEPKPVASSPVKKQKRLTEVDKLLMDEGAVNMLYDVKNTEDNQEKSAKKKKGLISLDKANRDLVNKANLIKNDLQQNTQKDTQKSLRKKEAASPSPKKDIKEATPMPVSRKKSKDSARSSVHSPPASPGFSAAEASRIIRRHSSSSFSSTEALHEDGSSTRKKNSEPTKKRQRRDKDATKEVPKNNNNEDDNSGDFKTFDVLLADNLATIKLNEIYFTEQVLRELVTCLKDLTNNDACNVVVISATKSEIFSKGLDYKVLVEDGESTLKKKVSELASAVKDFLRCLLNFPKILLAAIQGECQGLAVTMLPLFDMVIASDTSTFSTPYSKMGSVGEGGFLLSSPHLNGRGLASELLFTSQVIKADDAFRRGLVTRLCWPEKYEQELTALLKEISSQSQQSVLASKNQLRHNLIHSTESAINSSTKLLMEHWMSAECQNSFLQLTLESA